MTARQVFYEGRVQGVGFRYTVRHIATGYDVVGWVKNLPDGRVEMQVSGEKAEVEGFIKAISESEIASHINKQDTHEIPPLKNARGFEITF